jgi:pullulanase/glycogen debranching enzyme
MLCMQDTFGGVMDSPSIIEDMSSEPMLASCKLIAASANDSLLPRSGERGFPHYGVLMEWNNRFGADMLALLRDNRRELAQVDRLMSSCAHVNQS